MDGKNPEGHKDTFQGKKIFLATHELLLDKAVVKIQ